MIKRNFIGYLIVVMLGVTFSSTYGGSEKDSILINKHVIKSRIIFPLIALTPVNQKIFGLSYEYKINRKYSVGINTTGGVFDNREFETVPSSYVISFTDPVPVSKEKYYEYGWTILPEGRRYIGGKGKGIFVGGGAFYSYINHLYSVLNHKHEYFERKIETSIAGVHLSTGCQFRFGKHIYLELFALGKYNLFVYRKFHKSVTTHGPQNKMIIDGELKFGYGW